MSLLYGNTLVEVDEYLKRAVWVLHDVMLTTDGLGDIDTKLRELRELVGAASLEIGKDDPTDTSTHSPFCECVQCGTCEI